MFLTTYLKPTRSSQECDIKPTISCQTVNIDPELLATIKVLSLSFENPYSGACKLVYVKNDEEYLIDVNYYQFGSTITLMINAFDERINHVSSHQIGYVPDPENPEKEMVLTAIDNYSSTYLRNSLLTPDDWFPILEQAAQQNREKLIV